MQLALQVGQWERAGEAALGGHCQAPSSLGSCPLTSSYRNLEAQRPRLSESCSIGKPACLLSSACARGLSPPCPCDIIKDSHKLTENSAPPVMSH